jgi:signal transduction histidine kinase
MIKNIKNENVSIRVDESIADIMESLKYIHSSTVKMDSLLKGLSKVLKAGQAVEKFEHLNINDILDDILETYHLRMKEAGVKAEVSALPACAGDGENINRLFSNLVDNALKYLDPERPGVIKISGHEDNGQAVYCVEDNGIGIAPEHQKKIFDIFQRLDPGGAQGEGLGLTIVRKIMEKHNGRIWLESEPGKGSRFFVSIPRVQS